MVETTERLVLFSNHAQRLRNRASNAQLLAETTQLSDTKCYAAYFILERNHLKRHEPSRIFEMTLAVNHVLIIIWNRFSQTDD